MTLLLGLDGCRGGWMAALWHPEAGEFELRCCERWPGALVAQADRVAVDIPIGLPQSGRRACDLAARARLPAGAASRVFLDLRRPLLAFADYPAANAWAKRDGHGLSKQAWFILPKVREADAALAPADQDKVFEAHPELVLHRIDAWRLLPNKTRPEGRARRLALLAAAGLGEVSAWFARFARRQARPDDLIDAAACALAARRIHDGTAERLPADPPRDARGLRMEIWS